MNVEIKPFTLKVSINNTFYTFEVSQTYISGTVEIFTLIYGHRSIQFQSNRPLLRNKGLNKKKIEWKAIGGKVKYEASLEKIKQELESHIKKLEKPPFNWDDHPKNQPY